MKSIGKLIFPFFLQRTNRVQIAREIHGSKKLFEYTSLYLRFHTKCACKEYANMVHLLYRHVGYLYKYIYIDTSLVQLNEVPLDSRKRITRSLKCYVQTVYALVRFAPGRVHNYPRVQIIDYNKE